MQKCDPCKKIMLTMLCLALFVLLSCGLIKVSANSNIITSTVPTDNTSTNIKNTNSNDNDSSNNRKNNSIQNQSISLSNLNYTGSSDSSNKLVYTSNCISSDSESAPKNNGVIPKKNIDINGIGANGNSANDISYFKKHSNNDVNFSTDLPPAQQYTNQPLGLYKDSNGKYKENIALNLYDPFANKNVGKYFIGGVNPYTLVPTDGSTLNGVNMPDGYRNFAGVDYKGYYVMVCTNVNYNKVAIKSIYPNFPKGFLISPTVFQYELFVIKNEGSGYNEGYYYKIHKQANLSCRGFKGLNDSTKGELCHKLKLSHSLLSPISSTLVSTIRNKILKSNANVSYGMNWPNIAELLTSFGGNLSTLWKEFKPFWHIIRNYKPMNMIKNFFKNSIRGIARNYIHHVHHDAKEKGSEDIGKAFVKAIEDGFPKIHFPSNIGQDIMNHIDKYFYWEYKSYSNRYGNLFEYPWSKDKSNASLILAACGHNLIPIVSTKFIRDFSGMVDSAILDNGTSIAMDIYGPIVRAHPVLNGLVSVLVSTASDLGGHALGDLSGFITSKLIGGQYFLLNGVINLIKNIKHTTSSLLHPFRSLTKELRPHFSHLY